MIYHAPASRIPANPSKSYSWWAVHAETLTPVRVTCGAGGRIALGIVTDPDARPTVFLSHPDADAAPESIRADVMLELHAGLNSGARLSHTRFIDRSAAELPEYLIVFDVLGGTPAIWRTLDPQLIIPVKTDLLLDQPTYWRTRVDLSAFGWEYWWTDCQQAYEALRPAAIAANG